MPVMHCWIQQTQEEPREKKRTGIFTCLCTVVAGGNKAGTRSATEEQKIYSIRIR